MKTAKRNSGQLVAVAGASQYGKSTWMHSQVKDAPRVLAWDPRGEFKKIGFKSFDKISDLAEALNETWAGKGQFSFSFGSLDDFDAFCELAYLWGMLWPSVIVAEEMADVTSSGKASSSWGGLVRKGLFYGNHMYAVVQRAQEIDKTTLGNATVIHTHGFVIPLDIEYMAKTIGVSIEEMAAVEKYHFLERHAGDKKIRRGVTRKL